MKFSATTSSLLCAMALSPSLAAAVPTGMEAPTSPNPPGTPSIRQFPSSPLSDSQHSPLTTRAPALRTGPGSPRRSIPSRLLKVHRRDPVAGDVSAQDAGADAGPLDAVLDPVTGLLKMVKPLVSPVTGVLGPVVSPVLDKLDGLPVAGPAIHKVTTGLGIMGANVNAATSSVTSRSEDQSISATSNSLQGSLSANPGQVLNGIPSDLTGFEGSLPAPFGGTADGFPSLPGLQFGSPFSVPNIPNPEKSLPAPPVTPPHAPDGIPSQPHFVEQLPNGLLIQDADGSIKFLPFSQISDHLTPTDGLLSVESTPLPNAPPPSPATPPSHPLPPSVLRDAASSHSTTSHSSSLPVHFTPTVSLSAPTSTPSHGFGTAPAALAAAITTSPSAPEASLFPVHPSTPSVPSVPSHPSQQAPVAAATATVSPTPPVSRPPVDPVTPVHVSPSPVSITSPAVPRPSAQQEDQTMEFGPGDVPLFAPAAIPPPVSPNTRPAPTVLPTANGPASAAKDHTIPSIAKPSPTAQSGNSSAA